MDSKFVKKAVYEVKLQGGEINEREEEISGQGLEAADIPETRLFSNTRFKSLSEQLQENARLKESGILDDRGLAFEEDRTAEGAPEELYLSDLVDNARNRRAEEAEIEAFRREQEIARLGPHVGEGEPGEKLGGDLNPDDAPPVVRWGGAPGTITKPRQTSAAQPQPGKRAKPAAGIRLTVKVRRLDTPQNPKKSHASGNSNSPGGSLDALRSPAEERSSPSAVEEGRPSGKSINRHEIKTQRGREQVNVNQERTPENRSDAKAWKEHEYDDQSDQDIPELTQRHYHQHGRSGASSRPHGRQSSRDEDCTVGDSRRISTEQENSQRWRSRQESQPEAVLDVHIGERRSLPRQRRRVSSGSEGEAHSPGRESDARELRRCRREEDGYAE